jgi:hypothetical protein
MSYGHQRNSGIPYIATYEEALKRYESVAPIRGRKDAIKPLGHRNRVDAYTIRKNADGGVECVLWQTPVITFNVDGTIKLKNYTYNTISTCNFISEVLRGVYATLHDFKIHVNFRTNVIAKHNGEVTHIEGGNYSNGFILDNVEGLILQAGTNNCYEILNAKPNMVHYIKRKATRDCEKLYADFAKYMLGNVKVRDGMFKEHEYKEMFGTVKLPYYVDNTGVQHFREVTHEFNVSSLSNLAKTDEVEKLFTFIESEDFTNKNKAVMMLATVGKHSYHEERVGESQMIHALKKCIIARHKYECFEEIELPLGKYQKDRYAYLFGYREV